jgi:hypothetical protein
MVTRPGAAITTDMVALWRAVSNMPTGRI